MRGAAGHLYLLRELRRQPDRRAQRGYLPLHNGDIYPCDHFVYPQWRLGNIRDISLREAATSPALTRFGLAKRTELPGKCLRCPWLRACRGGCPKHRFASASSSALPLCPGYSLFYEHIAPVMDKMKALLSEGRAPSEIVFQ